MTWTEDSPWIIAGWVVSIGVAFLGGLNAHRLTARREAVNRRREFRSRLRDLGAKAREQHAMYLWKFYDEHRDGIRSACLSVEDDVPWIRKRRFRKLVASFLEMDDSDLRPPSTISAKDKEGHKREFQQVCVALQKLLNDIADAA